MASLDQEPKVDRLILPHPSSPFEALFGPLEPEARIQVPKSALENLGELIPGFSDILSQASIYRLLAKERCLMLLPCQIRIR